MILFKILIKILEWLCSVVLFRPVLVFKFTCSSDSVSRLLFNVFPLQCLGAVSDAAGRRAKRIDAAFVREVTGRVGACAAAFSAVWMSALSAWIRAANGSWRRGRYSVCRWTGVFRQAAEALKPGRAAFDCAAEYALQPWKTGVAAENVWCRLSFEKRSCVAVCGWVLFATVPVRRQRELKKLMVTGLLLSMSDSP